MQNTGNCKLNTYTKPKNFHTSKDILKKFFLKLVFWEKSGQRLNLNFKNQINEENSNR